MSWAPHPQARPDGSLRHLLTLDGLPRRHLEHLLRWAERYLDHLVEGRASTALPGNDDAGQGPLSGLCVIPMRFDETDCPLISSAGASSPSDISIGAHRAANDETHGDVRDVVGSREALRGAPDDRDACVRAALALGARIGNVPVLAPSGHVPSLSSSAADPLASADGALPRPLIDWLPCVADAHFVVLEHPQNGAPFLLAAHCAPHQQIVNAGDGSYARPIDALCLVLAILRQTSAMTERRVALVGDVGASAVARSILHALTTLGTPEIRVIGPTALSHDAIAHLGATWYADPDVGLSGVDIVIVLPDVEADGDTRAGPLPVVRCENAAGGASVGTSLAPDVLREAVWMAVFSVLAGGSDADVGRVVGTRQPSPIDAPGGATRSNGRAGQ
jgi:hypothetical protein